MTKFFIVPNSGDTVYHLIAETGEHLASHWCSHAGYAKSDLEANRPERQEKWKEKFGDYQVMFLSEQTEITDEELIKRNKEWFEGLPKEQEDASVGSV